MARKYDLISELYNRTCKTVVSNPQNWKAFLASACRNYKLRYDEQLRQNSKELFNRHKSVGLSAMQLNLTLERTV